eukprot:Tamp_11779.p1 GENE.Tamp_11779~~Tamp_11779.p1  ORF type:complete len:412 (-),score=33.91 Tamp_11779:644-1792(-)
MASSIASCAPLTESPQGRPGSPCGTKRKVRATPQPRLLVRAAEGGRRGSVWHARLARCLCSLSGAGAARCVGRVFCECCCVCRRIVSRSGPVVWQESVPPCRVLGPRQSLAALFDSRFSLNSSGAAPVSPALGRAKRKEMVPDDLGAIVPRDRLRDLIEHDAREVAKMQRPANVVDVRDVRAALNGLSLSPCKKRCVRPGWCGQAPAPGSSSARSLPPLAREGHAADAGSGTSSPKSPASSCGASRRVTVASAAPKAARGPDHGGETDASLHHTDDSVVDDLDMTSGEEDEEEEGERGLFRASPDPGTTEAFVQRLQRSGRATLDPAVYSLPLVCCHADTSTTSACSFFSSQQRCSSAYALVLYRNPQTLICESMIRAAQVS